MSHSGAIIENCYNAGTITGNYYVGGIAGRNDGTIANAYNNGLITGKSYVGGIAGDNYADESTIENCYNIGNVVGELHSAGGLAGGTGGIIMNCYNTGAVTGGSMPGGIVGNVSSGSVWYTKVQGCYYNSETSNSTNSYGTAKTTAEMKNSSFVQLLGEDNWKTDTNNINNGYPILKWQE